jgi:hypothetical protein
MKAMAKEIKALIHNHIWQLKPLPPGRKTIRVQWLFKLKWHTNSIINHFKAQWVAKGYSQHPGVNFNKTFSPIIHMENLHLLLTLTTALNLEVHQMDIDTTFLNTKLTKEVYMDQPEGFIDPDKPHYTCRLLKSLYGLNQHHMSGTTHSALTSTTTALSPPLLTCASMLNRGTTTT